mmetsp:Transcript_20223/g.29225  ORF Transcript_20223/g.29225 Transcript_20223/m.29225 type:complete len:308 (-) Transcript_20223:64-987(-)
MNSTKSLEVVVKKEIKIEEDQACALKELRFRKESFSLIMGDADDLDRLPEGIDSLIDDTQDIDFAGSGGHQGNFPKDEWTYSDELNKLADDFMMQRDRGLSMDMIASLIYDDYNDDAALHSLKRNLAEGKPVTRSIAKRFRESSPVRETSRRQIQVKPETNDIKAEEKNRYGRLSGANPNQTSCQPSTNPTEKENGSKASVKRIGIYTCEERKARIARFHAKRKRRIWRKRIKYDCRKKLAECRPRIKGRFVRRKEFENEEDWFKDGISSDEASAESQGTQASRYITNYVTMGSCTHRPIHVIEAAC